MPRTGLADEGEVVVATGSVGDRRPAVDRDVEPCSVQDGAAGDVGIWAERVANSNCTTGVSAAVDVSDGDRAAVSGSRGDTAIPRRGDVNELVTITKEPVSQALRRRIGGCQDPRRRPDCCPVDAMSLASTPFPGGTRTVYGPATSLGSLMPRNVQQIEPNTRTAISRRIICATWDGSRLVGKSVRRRRDGEKSRRSESRFASTPDVQEVQEVRRTRPGR